MKGMIMPQQRGEADEDFGLWGHEGRRLSNHNKSHMVPPPPAVSHHRHHHNHRHHHLQYYITWVIG